MPQYNLILFLILTISFYGCTQDTYIQRPQIRVRNGHMMLIAAKDKNISIVTSGAGGVHLNGEDLAHITKLARNASLTLDQYKSNFGFTYDPHDDALKKRLEIVEANVYNLSSAAPTKFAITRINRRLTMMQRRLRSLNLLLYVNECVSNPCMNGGTCQDLYSAYICQCPDQWEGPKCNLDVNECQKFLGTDLGCQNGATCINKIGSYDCQCASGWFGLHCTKRTVDCNSGGLELCGHGICITQTSSVGYSCICDQGWTTDSKTPACNTDVNECDIQKPPCSVNPIVECINVPGSFRCGNCPQGYSGNGYYCVDIDECSMFNGGCSMNPYVQCTNTMGSRTCGTCPAGYIGNGLICSYQGGVCGVNNGGCHPAAQCRDNPRISLSFVECVCPLGYSGNGVGPGGCLKSQSVDPCLPNPCVHGTCTVSNITKSYICNCRRRYTGRNCDIRKNSCDSSPCLNGGTCADLFSFSYMCTCTDAYTGDNCQEEKQACGGKLKGLNGVLQYPATESISYNHQISCAWVIETIPTKILNIMFNKFNLEASNECQFDWLQIHDGKNSASHMIGRFCGANLPNGGNITTTTNLIYLWFRSDTTLAKGGFSLNWTSIEPVCGEIINVTSHGTIKSPGSPGFYPLNRDCYWKLKVLEENRLEFHFFSLMIGNSSNCTSDYLEFISSDNVVFARYCNTSHPPPLISTNGDVTVHFHSDAKNAYPGFQISYTLTKGLPGCSVVNTKESGIITPIVRNGFSFSITNECEAKIHLLEGSRIYLQFTSFDVGLSTLPCNFQYVAIYDGPTKDSPLIGKYCGKKIPSSYFTLGNQVLIVYTPRMVQFNLLYRGVCGGQYIESSGLIESKNYPDMEASYNICQYEIVQPMGRIITLDINDISFETDCDDTVYLEVRDGDSENSPLIGRYCNSTDTVISTLNYLRLTIHSRNFRKSYSLNYTTTDIGCGGIMKTDLGSIKSPSYPNPYPAELDCTWIIVAPLNVVIQLAWLFFDVEQSYECHYDYVAVYDNNTDSNMGGLIGKYCGSITPPVLLSTSNMVTIKFKTDTTKHKNGFLMSYIFVLEENVCGGKYFTNFGVIKTPRFPRSYPASSDCTWVIKVQPGRQIMLNVTDFELENYAECRYDFLEIRNGGTASSPLIGKFCGTTINKLIPSHANQLYLRFKADMTKHSKGFKIIWQSTSTGCGGTLQSSQGSIISPHYPEPYSRNTECYWRITVNAGSLIQIIFADLDLESHATCSLDYVQLFDGSDLFSKSLGKYCSSSHPPFIRSSGNNIMVKFRSDVNYQGRGFQLQFSTVCQNTLRGYSGLIESPNFPYPYPQDANCVWIIAVPLGNSVNISFSNFDLEASPNSAYHNCTYDYLEIKYYDANDEGMLVYGKYCGKEIPPPISIKSNHTEIHFFADNLLSGNGFRLEWYIDGCIALLTHPEGSIKTPNYPSGYPRSTRCEWLIQVDYGLSVMLTIDAVDLEHSTQCHYDFIEIYNGRDVSFPLLNRVCFAEKPTIITSSGNFMFVVFESDFSYTGKGFEAKYVTVPTKCGGRLVASSGTFTSRNYPKNFERGDNCDWLIEVQENHIIQLNFTEVDLPTQCSDYYIKVYDGPSSSHTELVKLCRNQLLNSTLISSNNTLFVEMRTGKYTSSKGFSATYETVCGAILKKDHGVIKFTESILESYYCAWTIIATRPDEHVSFTITYLENPYCLDSHDGVTIYNGFNESAPLIGTYCSRNPPTISSEGSMLHVNTSIGFSASYSTFGSTCGGSLEDEIGYFASPSYPKNYPINIECEWILNVSLTNSISLSFEIFDLVESEHCNDDYLEVRESNNHGKLLGVFCGSNKPPTIKRVGSLWILFKSARSTSNDTENTAKGFLAEYTLNHETVFSGPSGKIFSPLYPKYYTKEGTYTWRIIVKFGYRILLKVIDLYMDYGGEEDYCYYAYLSIYDGYDRNAPELGTVCGTTIPEPYKSTSNVLFVTSVHETARHGSRFLLEWLQVENMLTSFTKSTDEDCGSSEPIVMHTMENYTFSSPGYPYGYAPYLHCEWQFTTTSENHLLLKFLQVNLENLFGSCFMDAVKVYSGKEDGSWDLIATACMPNDSYLQPAVATNLMKVVFDSDGFANQTGFSARVYQKCGGTIKESSGTLSILRSYNMTYGFANILECQWNITVRSGKTIRVQFPYFHIKNDAQKCDNYLLLKNGHYADSPLLNKGKFCEDVPEVLKTTGNHLYVKYLSNSRMNEFTLTYEEVSINCGGRVSLTNAHNATIVSSPNYPNIPSPYTECIWIITAPAGESLRVDFIERFDLTEHDNCSLEYVELRNGGSKASPLIGRYCSESPSSQVTKDNMLFIKFFTDVHDPKNGFKSVVSISTCGGVIRDKTGEIRSPYYGSVNAYPTNVDCVWYIIGARDHYLTITFKTLQLSDYRSSNCDNNYLEITEKVLFNNVTSLGKFCYGVPDVVKSSSNEVTIRLKTDKWTKYRSGFLLNFNTSQEECGGNLETDSGEIVSPGYPVMNHMHRTCEWIITVPKGQRIKIEITDFDLDNRVEFHDQGLAFFNGDLKSLIVSMKAGDPIRTINSSDNIMSVYFWSSLDSNHRGFTLKYTSDEPTICIGDFNQNSGMILSPFGVNSYYCSWTRNSEPPANRTLLLKIEATFTSGTPEGGNCKYASNFLIISGGDEKNIIQEICSTINIPRLIRTPYLVTKLTGIQTKFHGKFNFTMTYNNFPCGGIISDSQGVISSPNYPNKLVDSMDCVWVIKLPEEHAIKLDFISMDLGDDCEKNFITIHNGLLKTNPKIATYCRSNMPGTIRSQSNGLWIEYHKDVHSNGKGFQLKYEPIIAGCGGIFYDSSRIIQTPSYPSNYPSNAECEWEIHGPTGYHIGLEFIDRFQLEASDNCENDFLEIWDFTYNGWKSLAKLCDRNNPPYVNSTSNKMKILFRSNDKTSGTGFKAKWQLNCGGDFVADGKTKYIISPGYPNGYSNYMKCVYNITAPHKYINIVFEDFSLERGQGDCVYDNVTIVSKALLYFPVNKNLFCGTSLPPPLVMFSSIIVTFQTDSFITRKGFKFSYQVDACGGEITEPTDISSPMQQGRGPRLYGQFSCIWNITAPTDKVVIVRFESFHLMHNIECIQNSIEIYNSLNMTKSNRLAVLCGNLTYNLPVIKSNVNTMVIKYKGYPLQSVYQFNAKIDFTYGPNVGCGGIVPLANATTYILRGPTGLSYIDCHWQIIAGDGYAMSLNLLEKDSCKNYTKIHNVRNCSCSLLEIRDGGGIFSELESEVCENDPPRTYTTSGSLAWVRWLTNGFNTGNGFKLQIRTFKTICGPKNLFVSNTSQYLRSPNYPESYPDNVKCVWRLQTPSIREKIFLKFSKFDLGLVSEPVTTCGGDRVEITDNFNTKVIQDGLGSSTIYSKGKSISIYGGSRAPIGTHQYCGDKATEFDYYSGRNDVIVSFYSGISNHGKGFELEYKIIGCDRNYTSSQGRLLNERISVGCVISIIAPENTTISLYFLSFYMSDVSSTCQNTYFEVFDGDSFSSPSLAKICGYRIPNPVFTTKNKMLIHVEHKGTGFAYYDATYVSTTEGRGCGGEIFNYKGRFTSPMYPKNFRNISECVWNIRIPAGLQSAIKFSVFDIMSPCETDYVTVTTYVNDEENEHRYCKENNPPILHSSNRIKVTYKTSYNNGGAGWVAQFTALTDDYILKW